MLNNEMQKLKAVILVGGPGTRLQPLTDNIPKSVVPILNRPFMEHTFAYLKYYGIEDIILAALLLELGCRFEHLPHPGGSTHELFHLFGNDHFVLLGGNQKGDRKY